MTNISIRRGEERDQFEVFKVFRTALFGLLKQLGMVNQLPSINEIERLYPSYESYLMHIFDTRDQFWVAESNGQVIGYARSIAREGTRQLTEFFFLPYFHSHVV